MIGALRGIVRLKTPEKLLLDVGGVMFEVNITLNTYYNVKEGDTVYCYTYTHLSDGEISLYGFVDKEEKRLFESLLKVHGIGPRFARNILSGTTPEELRNAIQSKDIGRLIKVPGIGKKLAEKILFELKNVVFPEERKETYRDVVSALMNLGFKKREAEEAVNKVRQERGEELAIEVAIKEALKHLSSKSREK